MTAQVTLLIGVAVFALCVAIPELVHLWDRGVGLTDKTISHYLRGPLGYITDIGFLIFGLALLYVGWSLGSTWGGWSAGVLGIAMLLVMATARFFDVWFDASLDQANRWHVAATGVALIAAASLIAAESSAPAMWILGAAYPIVTALGFAFKSPLPVVEKLAVVAIALWLVAYSLT